MAASRPARGGLRGSPCPPRLLRFFPEARLAERRLAAEVALEPKLVTSAPYCVMKSFTPAWLTMHAKRSVWPATHAAI